MEKYQESLMKNDIKLISVLVETVLNEIPKKDYINASAHLTRLKDVLFASVRQIFVEKHQARLDAENLLKFLNEK